MHKYFKVLQEEAETHATRVICEATGVGLRNDEVDLVKLLSLHTKRKLYHKNSFEIGYRVRSDAKGRHLLVKKIIYANLKNIGLRDLYLNLSVCGGYFWSSGKRII